MVQKNKIPFLFDGGIKASSKSDEALWGKVLVDGVSAVTVSSDQMRAIHRTVLKVNDLALPFAHATDSGTIKLTNLPNTNIKIVGSAVNLTGTKGGVSGGLEAATDINLSLGTTATADSTLGSTDANLIASTAITDNSLSAVWQAGGGCNVDVAAGASNGLHINLGTGNLGADDTLTLSGTVYLYWIDLGTYAGG